MATMTWAERGIVAAQQAQAQQVENEQRAIIAARFIANHRGAAQDDLVKGLMVAQSWGFGYAQRSIHLALQANMVKYLACADAGCKGVARGQRESVMLHKHVGAA